MSENINVERSRNTFHELFNELEMNGYLVIPRGSRVGVKMERRYLEGGDINTVMFDLKVSETLTLEKDIYVYPGVVDMEKEEIGSYFLVPPEYLKMKEGDVDSQEELEKIKQELVNQFVDQYALSCDRDKYICGILLSLSNEN